MHWRGLSLLSRKLLKKENRFQEPLFLQKTMISMIDENWDNLGWPESAINFKAKMSAEICLKDYHANPGAA